METITTGYQLPYSSPAIDSFIELANNTHQQAEAAEALVRYSMHLQDNTWEQVLPKLPQNKTGYSATVLQEYKSICDSVESAIKARSGEAEALHTSIRLLEGLLGDQDRYMQELSTEIDQLNFRAETMRKTFAVSADDVVHSSEHNDQARALLSTLEATYERHTQLKACKQRHFETESDLEYLRPISQQVDQRLTVLQETLGVAKNNLRHANEYFGIDPEAIQEQMDLKRRRKNTPEPAVTAVVSDINREARPSAWSMVWSYVKVILLAFLLAFVIRAYVLDVTEVDGLSMFSTLNDGDILITSKTAYWNSDPQYGDIVVFDAPDSPGEDYVKRIIGTPNDQVTIEKGVVYVNGQRMDEIYLDNAYTDGDIDLIVPEGFYFVMGDNRSVSRDSRDNAVGVINGDAIHGKAVFRLFPFNTIGTLY